MEVFLIHLFSSSLAYYTGIPLFTGVLSEDNASLLPWFTDPGKPLILMEITCHFSS